MLPVLLQCVFGNAADDRSTDRAEKAVVGLVASVAAGGTTGESTSETALTLLALLSLAWGSLVVTTARS